MRISDVLRGKPPRLVTLPCDATALDAAALMKAERVGAILIGDRKGGLLGVMSERNLALGVAAHGAAFFRKRVTELMSAAWPTARPDDGVVDVLRLMAERHVRHVPVVDGERIVGIVSIGDLTKARLAAPSLRRRRQARRVAPARLNA